MVISEMKNGDPYPLEDWQKTAADYAMYMPNDQKQVNVRDWNSSKIVFTPEKAEYWLNGKKGSRVCTLERGLERKPKQREVGCLSRLWLCKKGKIMPTGPRKQDLVPEY